MAQLVAICLPLLAFMLIPLWIPLIATLAGALLDAISARR